METVDYNYYASTAQQPFHYMGFGGDGVLLSGGVGHEHGGSLSDMEHPLDTSAFLPGSFDYTAFDAPLGHSAGLTPLPAPSASPPPHPASDLHRDSMDSAAGMDGETDARGMRGSSEEKDNLTPAQSRRKAQNRAAQRAFRERKERHVRDLEAKLNLLTTTTSSLQSDNERLKLMLQRAQTENEILRASTSQSPTTQNPPAFVDDPSLLPASHSARSSPRMEEMRFDSIGLANGLLLIDPPSPGKHSNSSGDSHMLSTSATWDLIQAHPLYMCGTVDLGEVCERLKKMARCDGGGPMFDEDEVRKAIEEVGRSGGDELI